MGLCKTLFGKKKKNLEVQPTINKEPKVSIVDIIEPIVLEPPIKEVKIKEVKMEEVITKKSLENTDSNGASKNVNDIVFWGNGDTFKLISKASSKSEGWMKSTKAMSIPQVGCVVQVTTQQGDNIAEAVTFVPGVMISENKMKNSEGELVVISRKLIKI